MSHLYPASVRFLTFYFWACFSNLPIKGRGGWGQPPLPRVLRITEIIQIVHKIISEEFKRRRLVILFVFSSRCNLIVGNIIKKIKAYKNSVYIFFIG
jgi:hypothetical protein